MTVVILDEFILILKKMPKAKYNRPALKLEYFKDDIDEVKRFFKERYKVRNAQTSKMTTWWSKEKLEYKNQIVEKALMKNAEKTAKELELPMEQLTIAKKNAVIKVIQMMMNNDLDMSDMERSIKILRTEMWLPTSYAKNENTNIDKLEAIHIIFGWAPTNKDEDK